MDNFFQSSFDMPAGLSMALSADPEAKRKFSSLPDQKKWEVVSGSHAVETGKEMKRYVRNIISAY